jgi:glycosyltransferase involved in cell wall biosynthesis
MNRPDWEQNPGGDTVVIKEYMYLLKESDNHVEFSSDPEIDMSNFDIIHLVNLIMNGCTELFARSAVRQKRPFVITTLQEDFPLFKSKSDYAARTLTAYVKNGQKKDTISDFTKDMEHLRPSTPVTSPYAALTSDRLLACGETEVTTIRKIFNRSNISIVKFGGSKAPINSVGPDLFIDTFGISDFLLCVGRVEPRKNQLMLLTALENDSIPIVFIDGGTTYKPSYKEACCQFKRSGTTIFTGRVSEKLLISAFKAARVHCLPSFYELPGLVSLEAARYGCQVVGTNWGTLPDYLKNKCFYCQPDSLKSIRSTVLDAYETTASLELSKIATSYTWEQSVDQLTSVYNDILENPVNVLPAITDNDLIFDPLSLVEIITRKIEKGDFLEAVTIYKNFRSKFQTDSQLQQVDQLIQNMEKQLNS